MPISTGSQSGNYRIDPGLAAAYPEAANSRMIALNRKDWEERFQPIEKDLIKEVSTEKGEVEAQKAGADVAQQSAISRGTFLRNLSRTNTQLTQRQAGAIDRKEGLALARGTASAKNLTRRSITEQNLQRTSELIGIGRNIQQGASQGIGEASSLAAQRAAATKQAQQAHKAQTQNVVATGIGLAAAAFFI